MYMRHKLDSVLSLCNSGTAVQVATGLRANQMTKLSKAFGGLNQVQHMFADFIHNKGRLQITC